MTVQAESTHRWYDEPVEAVVAALGTEAERGLYPAEAAARLERFGPNAIASEPPPTRWMVALIQLRDPMNLMLVAVVVVSLVIGQVSTALLVAALVLLNVVLGTSQEMKARANAGPSRDRAGQGGTPRPDRPPAGRGAGPRGGGRPAAGSRPLTRSPRLDRQDAECCRAARTGCRVANVPVIATAGSPAKVLAPRYRAVWRKARRRAVTEGWSTPAQGP